MTFKENQTAQVIPFPADRCLMPEQRRITDPDSWLHLALVSLPDFEAGSDNPRDSRLWHTLERVFSRLYRLFRRQHQD